VLALIPITPGGLGFVEARDSGHRSGGSETAVA